MNLLGDHLLLGEGEYCLCDLLLYLSPESLLCLELDRDLDLTPEPLLEGDLLGLGGATLLGLDLDLFLVFLCVLPLSSSDDEELEELEEEDDCLLCPFFGLISSSEQEDNSEEVGDLLFFFLFGLLFFSAEGGLGLGLNE